MTPQEQIISDERGKAMDGKLNVAFLEEAARYFEKRPTGGEDSAHWSNVSNAENCRKASAAILAMAEDNARWSEAVATIIARCEAIEDEAYSGLELSPESAHAQGFWKGQKDAAKSIRRHLSDLTRALAKENASA